MFAWLTIPQTSHSPMNIVSITLLAVSLVSATTEAIAINSNSPAITTKSFFSWSTDGAAFLPLAACAIPPVTSPPIRWNLPSVILATTNSPAPTTIVTFGFIATFLHYSSHQSTAHGRSGREPSSDHHVVECVL